MARQILACTMLFLLVAGCRAECPLGCTCSPGGQGYDVTCNKLAAFPTLPRNITKLTMKYCTFSDIPKTALEGLADLSEFIVLFSPRLATIESGVFANSTSLKKIHIQSAPALLTLQNDTLSGAIGLQELKLDSTGVTSLNGELFSEVRNLSKLTIRGQTVLGVKSETFEHMIGLRHLILADSILNLVDDDLFAKLVDLQTLDLSSNKLTTAKKGAFTALQKLEDLNLSGNDIDEVQLGAFEQLTNLKNLDLSYNKFTNINADDLKDSHGLENLKLMGNIFATVINKTFLGMANLKALYLNAMPSLTTLEPEAFVSLTSLVTLDMSCNYGLRDIAPGALNITDLAQLKKVLLNNDGYKTLDKSIFTTKPNLANARVENNSYQCDCDILGFRELMEDTAKYPFAANWLTGQLAPVCKTPDHLTGRLVSSLDTKSELVCGEPEANYVSPANLSATDGTDVTMMIYVVSSWPVTLTWTTPSQNKINAPYASHTKQDAIDVTEEKFVKNATILARFTISVITPASVGRYSLTAANKVGTVAYDFHILSVEPDAGHRLGAMEVMVIIICMALAIVMGALLIGIYHKQKKMYLARLQDEERQGLLADRR